MDNFTHSFAGMAIAEGVHLYQSKKNSRWTSTHRTALYALSIIANNIPDIDFVWTGITGGKIGYLMHHRGHSHTLGGFLLELPIVMGIFWLMSKKWSSLKVIFEPGMRVLFWLVCLLGLTTHIFLDSWNSYGVHPFWPFSNQWWYGDSVFIFEPWIWLIALCGFWPNLKSWWARGIFLMLGVISLTLIWSLVFFDWKGALFFTGMLPIGFYFMKWLRSPLKRLTAVVSFILIFVSAEFLISANIRKEFQAEAAKEGGERTLTDVILTAMPFNPFCWIVIKTKTTRDGLGYFLKRGVHSINPDFIEPQKCAIVPEDGMTAPVTKLLVLDVNKKTYWLDEYEGSRSRLVALNQENCKVEAFLRFSRAPFVIEKEDKHVLGDLRYDREKAYGFSEYEAAHDDPCPKNFTEWESPVKALLFP
jgi:inner membrane protein